MSENVSERIAILGASRGLGAALAEQISETSFEALLLVARNRENLERVKSKVATAELVQIEKGDFSQNAEAERIGKLLANFQPTRVFVTAGGGAYGKFQDKEWKDQTWTFQVNFVFPAHLLHFILRSPVQFSKLRQIIFVGSSIAEHQPDPMASAYAASKHALRGLITSVQQESPPFDLRLFSPGYMDTGLLPANAWPRQKGLAESPQKIAQTLYEWALQHDAKGHFQIRPAND